MASYLDVCYYDKLRNWFIAFHTEANFGIVKKTRLQAVDEEVPKPPEATRWFHLRIVQDGYWKDRVYETVEEMGVQ